MKAAEASGPPDDTEYKALELIQFEQEEQWQNAKQVVEKLQKRVERFAAGHPQCPCVHPTLDYLMMLASR